MLAQPPGSTHAMSVVTSSVENARWAASSSGTAWNSSGATRRCGTGEGRARCAGGAAPLLPAWPARCWAGGGGGARGARAMRLSRAAAYAWSTSADSTGTWRPP